jgi:hypothetical protein
MFPLDQSGGGGPVDELDGRVMAKFQRLGEFRDGRLITGLTSLDGKQELMLGRCEPGVSGRLFGEVKERTKRPAELGQSPVFGHRDGRGGR